MDRNIQRKLQADAKKSGFAFELDVVERLRKKECIVWPNLPFIDDSGEIHEIDALAMMPDLDDTKEWQCGYVAQNLIIECKSSVKKPWVFFKEVFDPISFQGLVSNLQYFSDINIKESYTILAGCMNTALREHHYNSYDIPKALTYFEAFGKDAGTNIYKAVMNVWRAISFYKKMLYEARTSSKPNKKLICFMHGIILFDGILVLAEKNDDKFEFSEVPHVMLRTINCLTDKTPPFGSDRETIIDVVRKDHLENYLSICRNDFKFCIEHLNQIASAGWIIA